MSAAERELAESRALVRRWKVVADKQVEFVRTAQARVALLEGLLDRAWMWVDSGTELDADIRTAMKEVL